MLDFDGVELSDEVKQSLIKQVEEKMAGTVSQEEFGKVLANRDELLGEKKNAQQKAQEKAEEAEQARLEAAKKGGDIESLDASWQEKYNSLQSELNDMRAGVKKAKVNELSLGFVNECVVDDAVSREAVQAAITKRLDLRDGKPVVLDPDGNLTALSVNDLFNEFKTADKYKSHILATKADGGGAAGGNKSVNSVSPPKSLADCKGDPELERQYFNNQRQNLA